jgi:hypothetical protein
VAAGQPYPAPTASRSPPAPSCSLRPTGRAARLARGCGAGHARAYSRPAGRFLFAGITRIRSWGSLFSLSALLEFLTGSSIRLPRSPCRPSCRIPLRHIVAAGPKVPGGTAFSPLGRPPSSVGWAQRPARPRRGSHGRPCAQATCSASGPAGLAERPWAPLLPFTAAHAFRVEDYVKDDHFIVRASCPAWIRTRLWKLLWMTGR